jgi:hypothetical protein
MGRILKTEVDKVIGSKLTADNILVTDAWRAYKTYASDKGLEHYRLKANGGTHVIKGIYHIQNVNAWHSRLMGWIRPFKGVASKYLDNYLAWFLFVDSHGHESSKQIVKDNMLLTSFSFEMNETNKSIRMSKFAA